MSDQGDLALRHEHVFDIRINFDKRWVIAPLPGGGSQGYTSVGADCLVSGPRLNGKLVDFSGADWPLVRADGVVELNAHYMIEADDGTFSSGLLYQSKTFTYTFPSAGTWKYHDSLAGSTGFEVTVVAGPAADDPGSAADGSSAAVNILDLAFTPGEVTVVKGAKVTWTNSDAAAHTVAAKDKTWSSDLMTTGMQFDHVFDSPGRYEYVCTLHPGMRGTLHIR